MSAKQSSRVNGPKAAVHSLQEQVARLKNKLAEARKTIKHLEAELTASRKALYAQLRKQFPKESWDDFDPQHFSVSAEEMLAEAEKLAD